MIARQAALLLAVLLAAAPLSAQWESGAYTYDGTGSIIAVGEDDYLFDHLGRLTMAGVVSHGVRTTDSYRYDAYGNLVERNTNGPGGTSVLQIPAAWQTNRTTTATYDEDGNVVARGAQTYAWDSLRMMTHLTAPGRAVTHIYSATDDRIASRSGDQWEWTVRSTGGRVLRRFRSTEGQPWTWVEDVAHRDAIVAGTERPAAQGGRRHFHVDHLGSPRVVTDDAGRVLSRHDFLPFGVELTSIRQEQDRGNAAENLFRFTGHERDFVGGTVVENTDYLDYMRGRYYVPVQARFLSIDPGGFDARQPQSWNRYSYVQGNPITRLDPDGRSWQHFLDVVRTKFLRAYEHLDRSAKHFDNVKVFRFGDNVRLCCAEGKAGPAGARLVVDIAPRVDDDGTVTISLRARMTGRVTPQVEVGPRGSAELRLWKDGGPDVGGLRLKGDAIVGSEKVNAKAGLSGEVTANVQWMGLNFEAGMNVLELKSGIQELETGLDLLIDDWLSLKKSEDEAEFWSGRAPHSLITGKGNF